MEPGESTRFLGVKIGFSHPNPPFFSLREPSRALARLRRRSIPVVASVHTPKFLIPHRSGTLFHFFSHGAISPLAVRLVSRLCSVFIYHNIKRIQITVTALKYVNY